MKSTLTARVRSTVPGAFWLLVLGMVIVAVAGSAVAHALAARVFAPPGLASHGHFDDAVGLTLPITLVNGAFGGWSVVWTVWIVAALLGVCGWAASRVAARNGVPIAGILAAQAVVGLVFSFFGITLSGDFYNYVAIGHAYGLQRVNPYFEFRSLALRGDPVLAQAIAYLGNPPPFDNYGPLWTLCAGLLSKVEFHLSLWAQVWTHRLAAVACAVVCTAGIFKIMKAPLAARAGRVTAFAFHPLVIYETAVGGHNDIIMLALAVWAFALAEELPLVGALLLGAAIAVKYVAIIALPFLAAYAWRKRAGAGILAVPIALAVAAVFFAPFWLGPLTFYSVIGHGGVFGMSPGWMINYPFFARGVENQPIFPGAPPLPFFGQPSWPRIVQLSLAAAFIVVVAWSWVKYLGTSAFANLWRSVAAFLWASPIIHPWYLLWLSPAVADRGRWATYAWWFGALILLRYALDTVAPAQMPIWLLFALTVVFLVAPVVVAMAKPGERTAQRSVETVESL